jgi:hypothetical protein
MLPYDCIMRFCAPLAQQFHMACIPYSMHAALAAIFVVWTPLYLAQFFSAKIMQVKRLLYALPPQRPLFL